MLNREAQRRLDLLQLENDEFATAVLDGLATTQKSLPCRFFYDARGSELFEEITRLPEYYPTRTEARILEVNAGAIAGAFTDGSVLVEFGSGSSLKTEILLRRLSKLRAYVSIDVSESALEGARQRLQARFPALDVRTVVGNFSQPVRLPADLASAPKVGFFPGSTIGNLHPTEAAGLLRIFRRALSPGGRLIVGVDLKKDPRTLVLAYNDAAGVTAAFNLNLLVRINRELGGTFDIDGFRHEAIYNPRAGRIEMHIESTHDQDVHVLGRRFRFKAGERIHTENSYKYTIPEFRNLAQSAGWELKTTWTDPQSHFSVHELASSG